MIQIPGSNIFVNKHGFYHGNFLETHAPGWTFVMFWKISSIMRVFHVMHFDIWLWLEYYQIYLLIICIPTSGLTEAAQYRDDVIKWKHFPRYWPFVSGIHRSTVVTSQRPATRSFEVFFDVLLNRRPSKQSRRWWFVTPSSSMWFQSNDLDGA